MARGAPEQPRGVGGVVSELVLPEPDAGPHEPRRTTPVGPTRPAARTGRRIH